MTVDSGVMQPIFAWAELYENLPCLSRDLVQIISVYAFPIPRLLRVDIRNETREILHYLENHKNQRKHNSICYDYFNHCYKVSTRAIGTSRKTGWAEQYIVDRDPARQYKMSYSVFSTWLEEHSDVHDKLCELIASRQPPGRPMLARRVRKLNAKKA